MSMSELRNLGLLGFCSLPVFACHEPSVSVGSETTAQETSTTSDPPSTATDTPTTAPDTTASAPADMDATTTSSGAADTSSTGTSTTTGSSWCGDGIVDSNEECDDGADGNGDTRFCKENCTLNVCGDGKLFADWELCDEGAANSDVYGSLCDTHCEPGARCGDHKLQPEYETCDLGLDNNGEKGDDQGILCDGKCNAQRLRGFITKAAYSGDLGGLYGADLKCRMAAKTAGLAEPERFYAYLSSGSVDAKDRFEKVAASWPYVLVTGKKFADSFAALIEAGPLGEGISVTEDGSTLSQQYVATNTQPGGIRFNATEHCVGWTSADGAEFARLGLNTLPLDSDDFDTWKAEQWWTGVNALRCNKTFFHIYCLEI